MRDERIYEAARAVFAQSSYEEFTHGAVAEQAGEDLGALKECWPDPAELLISALLDAVGPLPEDPGDAGLRTELLYVAERLAFEFGEHGDLLVGIMVALRTHPELELAFRERFLLPRIDCARKVFGRAMLRGELRPEADPRLVLSLAPALLTYRVLVRDPAPDDRLAEHLVDTVLLPLLLRP